MLTGTNLRVISDKPVGLAESMFGGVGGLLGKADDYMGKSISKQYLNIANPTGVYSVQCTEGSVRGAAEVTRVRALNAIFRASQSSPSKTYFDLYENRKAAISSSHQCHHEEKQFCDYNSVCESYNQTKAEAHGQCIRYGTPETIEEAAMVRYMDIQQNNAANPSGVYNTSCNEGSCRGQSEDLRVLGLNAAFRNGQKPLIQLFQEKYNQRKAGYAACHGCTYEEGIVCDYPAVGAAFRSRTYGY